MTRNGTDDDWCMVVSFLSKLSGRFDPSPYTVTHGFDNNASLYCTLQLILKSKATSPITLYFLMLRGPFGEMQIQPKIYHFEFSESNCESPLVAFPLTDSAECNKVLSGKAINCRLYKWCGATCSSNRACPCGHESIFFFSLSTGWSCSCVLSEAKSVPHVLHAFRGQTWMGVCMCSS